MIPLDFNRCTVVPFGHQKVGISALVANPIFGLFDEMGAGKTKQTIDAAQFLYTQGTIGRVIVVCPAPVRSVWFDPELGELAKHIWPDLPNQVFEWHAKTRGWSRGPESKAPLQWLITNYDFIRSKQRLERLMSYCGEKVLLVLDESSAVKNYRAHQTKACLTLRRRCGRILLLNGTPIANNPGDMYSQGVIMHPQILNCQSYFHFRSRYAVMGGWQGKQIVGWINLQDIQRRFAPYVLRRLKTDCLDLPPKLPPVTLMPALSESTWHLYKEMRDELVTWLSNSSVSTAPQAVVKILRLAQLTSGFLGGIEDAHVSNPGPDTDRPAWLPNAQPSLTPQGTPLANPIGHTVQETGREKLTAFLEWFDDQLDADRELKLLVWCRFRPEIFRLVSELVKEREKYKHLHIGTIIGGQKPEERAQAIKLLDPRTAPKAPVIVIGTPASGALGLNLAAAHTVMDISYDYNLKTYLQAQDRVHRPGQTYPVSYYRIVATGPQGQKTIDHAIIKARDKKEDVATWTTSAWIKTLQEE